MDADFASGLLGGYHDTMTAERDRRDKNNLAAAQFLISTNRVRNFNELLPLIGETLGGGSISGGPKRRKGAGGAGGAGGGTDILAALINPSLQAGQGGGGQPPLLLSEQEAQQQAISGATAADEAQFQAKMARVNQLVAKGTPRSQALELAGLPSPKPILAPPSTTVLEEQPGGGFKAGLTTPARPEAVANLQKEDRLVNGKVVALSWDPDRGAYVDTTGELGEPGAVITGSQKAPTATDPTLAAIRELTAAQLRMNAAQGGLTPSQVLNETTQLRQNWQKAIEPTIKREEAIAKLDSAKTMLAQGNRNAATQTVIFGFNKLLDEASVVREGEYARSEAGVAFINKVSALITRLTEGGAKMTDADILAFVRDAKQLAGDLNQVQGRALADYRSGVEETLKAYNIPSTRVFGQSPYGKQAEDTGRRNRARQEILKLAPGGSAVDDATVDRFLAKYPDFK